jgi:hypothetical protein
MSVLRLAHVLLEHDGRKQVPQNAKRTWQFASIATGRRELVEKEPFMSPLYRLTLQPAVLTLALALISSTSACVTTGTFDKKVAELDHVRADRDHVVVERDGLRRKLDDATPHWLASSRHGSRSWGRMSAS